MVEDLTDHAQSVGAGAQEPQQRPRRRVKQNQLVRRIQPSIVVVVVVGHARLCQKPQGAGG